MNGFVHFQHKGFLSLPQYMYIYNCDTGCIQTAQNLNSEGMHVVLNGIYCNTTIHQKRNYVGYLVLFEGMEGISINVQRVLTFFEEFPFKKKKP